MRLDFESNSTLAYFIGTSEEIDMLENSLNAWTGQFDEGDGECAVRVYGRSGGTGGPSVIGVLSGIIPSWLETADWSPGGGLPQVTESVPWEEMPELDDWLWAHQQAAVEAALMAPLGRGILEVPTGGGKTRIAAGLGSMGAALGGRHWLYAAPNLELLKQAKQTFDEVPGGGAVSWEFATYTQLAADPGAYGEKDGLICDECHRVAAGTWAFGVAEIRANLRVGMSGTPLDRTDSRNPIVMGLTGPVVMRVELPDLQEEGKLAKGSVVPIVLVHGGGGSVRRIARAGEGKEEEPQRRGETDEKLN